MGEIEFDHSNRSLYIHSHIITYGNEANELLTEGIRSEIEQMWNEPNGVVLLDDASYRIIFRITSEWQPGITPVDIYSNTNPRNNYFRIESFAHGNISFVDGLKSNTGYFLLENLYAGSTTAAHEYGHTLGLPHPRDLDYRKKGAPGIMYPRGTLVDSQFQYNPLAASGDSSNGGTMHPMHRRVRQEDITDLRIDRLDLADQPLIIGEFTSIWHPDHRTVAPQGY